MSQVHITVTGGAFLTGFALLLGAGNMTLAIVAALPFLIQPFQLFGAWLIERQGARKPLAVTTSMGRLLWLPIILLPYLHLTGAAQLVLLVLILLISSAMVTVCANAWTNWMTDLVPPRQRGRYFGTRNMILAVGAMVATYGAGTWLDHTKTAGNPLAGYTVIFALGAICAGTSTFLLGRQPEPRFSAVRRLPMGDVVRLPLRHPSFWRYVGSMMMWNAAIGIAAPFFTAYGLSTLHFPFTRFALFDVVQAGVSLLTLPLWGRATDRWGHRRILMVCMAGVVVLPLSWVITTPSTIWILYVNAVLSGVWWPGLLLA